MNEIEKLKAELAAVERELADADAAVAAIKAGNAAPKIRRAPKPAKPKTMQKKKRAVHRSALETSIEGYGGPAPVGASRIRPNNTPVVTRHVDPRERPVDSTYEGRECLLLAAVEAGSSLTGIRCGCAGCTK